MNKDITFAESLALYHDQTDNVYREIDD